MKALSDVVHHIFVDRLKNQALGAYVFSWVICNWKILLPLLFGTAEMSQRVDDAFEQMTNWSWILPLICASAYLFLSPWANLFIDYLQTWAMEHRKEWKARIQREDITREIKSGDLLAQSQAQELKREEQRIEIQNKRLEAITTEKLEQKIDKRVRGLVEERLDKIAQDTDLGNMHLKSLNDQYAKVQRKFAEFDESLKHHEKRLQDASEQLRKHDYAATEERMDNEALRNLLGGIRNSNGIKQLTSSLSMLKRHLEKGPALSGEMRNFFLTSLPTAGNLTRSDQNDAGVAELRKEILGML